MTVRALLEQVARDNPCRTALIDDATRRRYTFRQLADEVLAVAARLLALPWLERGDRVALLGDADANFLLADYGLLCSGLVRVCVDPDLNPTEILAQLTDAQASALLYDDSHRELVHALQAMQTPAGLRLVSLSSLAGDSPGTQAVALCLPADVASLNYTGGTTGTPKAVVHTQASLCAVVQNIVQARSSDCGDTMLNVRPLWPIASVLLLAHLANGGTLVLGGRFEPARFIELVRTYRPTCTSLVPTHLVRILRSAAIHTAELASLTCVEVGAGAIAPDLHRQAVAVFGPVFAVIYGLTEAPWSFYRPPAQNAEVLLAAQALSGLVGAPTRHTEVMIRSVDDAQLVDDTGEILIRGPHLMQGYWRQAGLTDAVMRHGWFHTGDLGKLDARGRLTVLGRIKDVIRSGGKSVQPGEVVQALCRHAGVAEAAVFGMPHAEWGEIVVAAVVRERGHALNVDELVEYCRHELSSHKRPKRIVFVDQLPRSHYGKVQTAKLMQMLAESAPDHNAGRPGKPFHA